MIDRRPGLAIRCQGAADVMLAVELARKHGLSLRCAAAATTSLAARYATAAC